MLIQAEYLYTLEGQPIKNGMVRLDQSGHVLEIGQNLEKGSEKPEYLKGVVCPGFINTHCHLELSHLKGKLSEKEGLIQFIKEVQSSREAATELIAQAQDQADQEMKQEGIVAVGDISNGNSTFKIKQNSSIHYHTFIELFSFDPKQAEEVFKRGKSLKKEAEKMGLSSSLVPHSPYSVSDELFKLITKHNQGESISIHNQESEAENEFYQSSKGPFEQLLSRFGLDISHFQPKSKSSIQGYLNKLPIETNTLMVHNTFTSEEDIAFAREIHPKLFWAFCPRANLYIENRVPNFLQFSQAGLKCTLGTDSLASNYSLSILEEIKVIQNSTPEISLQTLFEWACKNGAEFLGLENFGSLKVGKNPGLNWIKNVNADGGLSKAEVVVIK